MISVREYHLRCGADAPPFPPLRADPDSVRSHGRLLRNAYERAAAELAHLARCKTPAETTASYRELLEQLARVRYEAESAAVTLGLDIDAAFAAVHASHMGGLPPNMELLVPNAHDIIDPQED